MTPEQERKLNEVYDWVQAHKENPLGYPVPDLALNAIIERLKTITLSSTSTSTLTQTYNVEGGGGGSITGPKAYEKRLIVTADGVTYHIPTLAAV